MDGTRVEPVCSLEQISEVDGDARRRAQAALEGMRR